MDYKYWYRSRTIWVAFLQGVIGVIVAFSSTHPELQTVGALATLKSALDIILRYLTTKPIIE
jgi:hypothetical protein